MNRSCVVLWGCAMAVAFVAGVSGADPQAAAMRAVQVVDGEPAMAVIAPPEPGPGDVRVRVVAAAVNPIDWRTVDEGLPWRASDQAGVRNPANVPGADAAGVVERLGPGVDTWRVGDQVVVFADDRGTYADLVVVAADSIAPKPAQLSFEEAAGIPTVGFAAYSTVVDMAAVRPGQRVLVHGGAGGVGSAAVQLAAARGAYVYATASAHNHAYLRSLGADETIDYTTTRFEDVVSDLDLVVNTVGAETAARSVRTLKPGGLLVSLTGGVPAQACADAGVRCQMRQRVTPVGEVLREIGVMAAEGRYRVHLDAVLPLESVAEAWDLSRTRHTRGKIVLRLAGDASATAD